MLNDGLSAGVAFTADPMPGRFQCSGGPWNSPLARVRQSGANRTQVFDHGFSVGRIQVEALGEERIEALDRITIDRRHRRQARNDALATLNIEHLPRYWTWFKKSERLRENSMTLTVRVLMSRGPCNSLKFGSSEYRIRT